MSEKLPISQAQFQRIFNDNFDRKLKAAKSGDEKKKCLRNKTIANYVNRILGDKSQPFHVAFGAAKFTPTDKGEHLASPYSSFGKLYYENRKKNRLRGLRRCCSAEKQHQYRPEVTSSIKTIWQNILLIHQTQTKTTSCDDRGVVVRPLIQKGRIRTTQWYNR